MKQIPKAGFLMVHRALFDLYQKVAEPDHSQVFLDKRLRAIRSDVLGSECPDQKICFERYLKLLALRLNAPEIKTKWALNGTTVPPPAGASPMRHVAPRILVSGIGRSGTTMIYQQLAKLLLADGKDVNFRYEPYLWNIQTAAAKGNPFDMGQLHQFGIYAHLETPLFLEGQDDVHDAFLDHLFAARSDLRSGQHPDAYLTKVIRGSGRLRSYVARFPDIKIVACLRNPFDTINSSLGMFSFFGEEFHRDDRARFLKALKARGFAVDHLSQEAPRSIEWYAAWWRAFTAETLAVARQHPDNVLLFCYEDFKRDPERAFEGLQNFIGLHNSGIKMGLDKPAGPSVKATSLTPWDVSYLSEHQDFYEREVLLPLMDEPDVRVQRSATVRRYAEGEFSFPIAGADAGTRAPIQLRGMMIQGGTTPFLRLIKSQCGPIDMSAIIEDQTCGNSEIVKSPLVYPEFLKNGKRFGAVIACHNNSMTVIDSVLSCLKQTLPYDRILVVDDKSTDDSLEKLTILAESYSAVEILPLESSLGPSGARHIGISHLDTDFWTQLDGDDLFWPTKNEEEARALQGRETAVSFSDILVVKPGRTTRHGTEAYSGIKTEQVFSRLLARRLQIPRDMTMSRSLYFEAGGYNLVSHLYEDWDFKLRLASLPGTSWCRADGAFGTVYNRLTPGLSGADPGTHARALILFFFKALGHYCPDPETILQCFAESQGPFKGRHVSLKARDWLRAALEGGAFDPEPFAALATSREVHGLENAELADLFAHRAKSFQTCEPRRTSVEIAQ